jgi:hypothetical protein
MNDLPDPPSEPQSQFLIYRNENGTVKINVRFENKMVWLSQLLMAELFATSKQNIAQHLLRIFEEGELRPEAVVNKFFTTPSRGRRRDRLTKAQRESLRL